MVYSVIPGAAEEGSELTRAGEDSLRKNFLSAQWIGFTAHPGQGSMPERYPLKLDKKGYAVLELGLNVNYDRHISGPFLMRVSAAYYKDCAFVNAGYVHIGFRGRVFQKGPHTINGGMGPTLIVREDWHQFPEYEGDAFFGSRVHGKWQYRFIPYGGEFEYLYRINEDLEFQASLIPGIPIVITTKFGFRWRF